MFDGGLRASQTAQAIAVKAAAQADLDADRDRIEDQVWTAYTDTQTRDRRAGRGGRAAQRIQASYQAATEAYGDGVRTLVDVITAERTLAQARSEEVTARTNVFQQATALAFRTGDLLRSHPGPAGQTPGTVSAPVSQPSPGTVPAPQPVVAQRCRIEQHAFRAEDDGLQFARPASRGQKWINRRAARSLGCSIFDRLPARTCV